MKKTIKLVSILLLAMLVVVSCSPEKTMDGKTAATKKQMTSTEYSNNREAIRSVTVVEAYAVANSDAAVSDSRGFSEDGLVYTFDGPEKVSTSEIIAKLEEKATNTSSDAEKAFYASLSASLPKNYEVSVEKNSFVRYKIDANGIKVVSSLDIKIIIDGKTIEIEKDRDDKWIEIDGTFFDDTDLEKMLDAAEDAAESIEEFFNNLKIDLTELRALIEGKAQEIKDGDFGKDAKATGSYSFSFNNKVKVFVANFNYEYFEVDEEEEKIKVEGTISFNFNTLEEAFSALFSEDGFEKFIEKSKDTIDVKLSVNGMEVWADAFLDELD
ncbi:MAG: hypothetical protein ACI4NI_00835 [Candidatus Ornithospirochaeta sp.]